jgi:hypothetical protein
MKRTLLHFSIKILILFIPLIIILVYYLSVDPFRVLHTYKNYNEQGLTSNTGYIGWQSYLNNRDSAKYDSFLFGNSCAMAYNTKVWQSYLQDAHPIKLHGSSEGLYAIYKKIVRLDERGENLKNVIILLDHSTLKKDKEYTKHTFILHPDISKTSQLKFQFTFLKAFLLPKIFTNYFLFQLTDHYSKNMAGIINTNELYRNQVTNDFINPRHWEIEKSKKQYWINHKKEFPERSEKCTCYDSMIKTKHKKMLSEIKAIFQKHQTNYQIIINPQWCQKPINPDDLKELKTIFETKRVHNYSGKNKYTENQYNFYEQAHYRPTLGRKILDDIYLKDNIADNNVKTENIDKI